MFKKCRNILRNEKGLTLIELLAVVVILGIIAAIAIPSIGSLIENSKKDAHVSNAQQMISSARLILVNDSSLVTGGKITLEDMVDAGYIENLNDPDKGVYDQENSHVVITDGAPTAVLLTTEADKGLYGGTAAAKTALLIADITRGNVK